jgi:phospholipase C
LPPSTRPLTQPVQPTSKDLALARQDIKHIVVIMQKNRSFDEYFGTYPGAIGIPMTNGVPTVCSPDPQTGQCIKPYYNPSDVNSGGPHAAASATKDIAGRRENTMNIGL